MREDMRTLAAWLEKRPDFNPKDPLVVAARDALDRLHATGVHAHYAGTEGTGSRQPGGEPKPRLLPSANFDWTPPTRAGRLRRWSHPVAPEPESEIIREAERAAAEIVAQALEREPHRSKETAEALANALDELRERERRRRNR